ncbi:MAG TPA: biosynthetic arginine decarboxylase [Gammaproteobacteria bacterium]
MNNPTVAKARKLYSIERWSDGYFHLRADGHVVCRPEASADFELSLSDLVQEILHAGLQPPILVRFQDILSDRVRRLCAAFDSARERHKYSGAHTVVYPIKVNQQRSVVEQIAQAVPGRVGLEAGSKPELMAILAQTFYKSSTEDHETLVCNGYKDREYIRLALIGEQLGKRVFIVVEKPDELELVLQQAKELKIEPRIGVRVRLASIAKGKWQNSGGEKSKFGLSATQLLRLIERLRDSDQLHCLQLLHVHMGSQVADLEDIRSGLAEVARYYQEMYARGIHIRVIDVGGGIGIDYDGTSSKNEFSINYRFEAYADAVVATFAQASRKTGSPAPEIITESGRALTAHHAVLLTNVVDVERKTVAAVNVGDLRALKAEAWEKLTQRIEGMQKPDVAQQLYEECESLFAGMEQDYVAGSLGLDKRALLEQQMGYCYRQLKERLQKQDALHPLLQQLNEKLADKYFCNISVFQSMPDIWGIGQVFPIMPLSRLHEPLTEHAILHDLTCDSDGQISAYVGDETVSSTLPVHRIGENESYWLGFFLVGAYQEILGDMHNLFGDTNSINVVMTREGGYRLEEIEPGDRIDQLLEYVHYDTQQLLAKYKVKLERSRLGEAEKHQYYLELAAGLSGYSYLED